MSILFVWSVRLPDYTQFYSMSKFLLHFSIRYFLNRYPLHCYLVSCYSRCSLLSQNSMQLRPVLSWNLLLIQKPSFYKLTKFWKSWVVGLSLYYYQIVLHHNSIGDSDGFLISLSNFVVSLNSIPQKWFHILCIITWTRSHVRYYPLESRVIWELQYNKPQPQEEVPLEYGNEFWRTFSHISNEWEANCHLILLVVYVERNTLTSAHQF